MKIVINCLSMVGENQTEKNLDSLAVFLCVLRYDGYGTLFMHFNNYLTRDLHRIF